MRRVRGLSLAESALCGLVLALVMVVLAQLYPMAVMSLQRSAHRLRADQLAQSLLDETEATPFEALQPGVEARPIETPDGSEYQATVRVFVPPESDPELLKGIEVIIRWSEKRGPQSVVHVRWIAPLPR